MARRKGLFGPAKHKKLAEIVTFESTSKAQKAAAKLKKMFKQALKQGDRKKALEIKRAAQLAANRAEASLKRRNLHPQTRKKLERIAEIYDNAEEWMKKRYR